MDSVVDIYYLFSLRAHFKLTYFFGEFYNRSQPEGDDSKHH